MPTPVVDNRISHQRKTLLEEVLVKGWQPQNVTGGRGSAIYEASRRLGIDDSCLRSWIATQDRRAGRGQPNYAIDWTKYRPPVAATPGPSPRAAARRYILTAAQDGTEVHKPFWRNLLAYAEYLGADIRIGGFTYNKALFEDHAAANAAYATELQPYMAHERIDLGPVVFCAEFNRLPTAVRPLSGLDAYTQGKWGVFPHAKVQLVSVPAIQRGNAALIMTTGAVTVPNYVPKAAGLKAEFHHVIGATMVEIDADGRPFCRQLNASTDGSFQDLDLLVKDGRVRAGQRVEAITWGDLHREKLDPVVALGAWGFDVVTEQTVAADNMLDVLRPRWCFWHDVLDFDARNHHRIKDHHHRFQMICQGTDLVEDAVAAVVRFLRATERDFGRQVVVFSNHDDALTKWLKTADYREDPANAPFFLHCQKAYYEAIREGAGFNAFRFALEQMDTRALEGIEFVDYDQSYVICQSAGGVECGQHGHQGPNGARGSPQAFTKMAVKMNTGHTHSASILDGVYTAGLSGLFDQGYNDGPSSWSHSHIVTYPSGKRSIVTMHGARWRA